MHKRFWSAVPLLAIGLLVTGCGERTVSKGNSKPQRSLDELYAMAAEVNAKADPYLLGTGDRIGRNTFDIYVAEVVMGHEE